MRGSNVSIVERYDNRTRYCVILLDTFGQGAAHFSIESLGPQVEHLINNVRCASHYNATTSPHISQNFHSYKSPSPTSAHPKRSIVCAHARRHPRPQPPPADEHPTPDDRPSGSVASTSTSPAACAARNASSVYRPVCRPGTRCARTVGVRASTTQIVQRSGGVLCHVPERGANPHRRVIEGRVPSRGRSRLPPIHDSRLSHPRL